MTPRGSASPGSVPTADASTADPASPTPRARFLQLSDVCTILDISASQTYALVRSGELPAIKIGGRGQWRVEFSQLEQFIARMYDETREFVATHPFGSADEWTEDEAARGAEGSDGEESAGRGDSAVSSIGSSSSSSSTDMVESA